jgi:hypothetical protein
MLVFLLLIFVPLHFTWAAVSVYCQHEESSSAARHFGHHDHQHQNSSPDPAKTGGLDLDCATCHATGVSALTSVVTLPPVPDATFVAVDYRAHLTSPPLKRPERPQWFLA